MTENSHETVSKVEAEPVTKPLITEAHVRMMPEDYDRLPYLWRNDYIDPDSDISLGDIIAVFTDSVTGVAAYEVGEILYRLYRWCKIGEPGQLTRSYEHMYHLTKYLYDANIGKLIRK